MPPTPPYQVVLPAWAASTADATVANGPYTGLLVSLHQLSLSIAAAGRSPGGGRPFDLTDARTLFAVNQFQHREIERQETLRSAVGLPTDIPLTHGVADPGVSDGDDQLVYAFRLLQALDLISLSLCCTRPRPPARPARSCPPPRRLPSGCPSPATCPAPSGSAPGRSTSLAWS